MERLFSPCTRLHDLLEGQFLGASEGLQELNLDVSTDDLLSAERAFTYADLYGELENEDTVAWLTPHAAVARAGIRVLYSWEHSVPTVNISLPWLAPPSIYWRFAMLFFDCWQQASFIQ
jgi:hypothetical protein